MSWKDRVKANEESGVNAKLRAEAAGNLYSAMRDYAATSGQYKDQGQRDQFERNISEYESIVNRLGSSGLDITGQDEVIKSFKSFHGDTSKIYSQFKNRGEYDAAVKAQKDYTAMLGFDTKAGQQEVDKLEKYLRKAKSLTPAGYSVKEGTGVTVNRNTQALNSYLKSVGYSSVDELEKAISDKRQYLTQAKRTQNKSKLDSDADNDKEFRYYSTLGAGMENPTVDDASPSIKVFGWEKGGSKVKNKVAYSRDNYDELMRRSASGVANGGGYSDSNFNADYMEMTDDEVNKYNYYLAKYGDEKADEYLDSLTETLSYRKATKGFKNVEGKTAEELAFSIVSGLDQFASGLGSLFSSEDYIPPSAVQMQSSLVREDLADKGPDIFGSSLGQTVYDLGTTTANMLPSIAVGTLVGMVNPIAGKVTGDALMGASAAGNAYTEMLNLGYDKSQARAYGTITGALEAGLQYLLGGIGALGGEVSGKAISKAVEGINNGAAKFAIKFGGEMASEGIEEALQEVLSPILKNAIFNTDESIDWEQVAYSGLLGAMSAGLFNSSNAVTNTVRMNNANKELYGSNLRDLVAESLELNPDNKLAKKIQRKLDSDSDVSGRSITKLINQNEADMQANDRTTIKAAAAEQLTKYGETGDVEALASAITKLTAGENLSRSERALIDSSEYGQRVVNELAPENIDSGEYNTEWAEKLGTDRINVEAYSKLLQDAQVETEQQSVDAAPVVENTQHSPAVREITDVTSSEFPNSQAVKSSLPAANTQIDTNSSVKDLSTKYGKQAGAFIHTYQQGQDIKKYDEAYSNAYDYGRSGVPFDTVKGLEQVAYLTEAQRELAYDAGAAAANTEASAKANDRTGRANGKTGRRTGAVKLEGAPASSLNEQQKRATRVLRTVAEATGVDIVLYKSDVNEAGVYEGANGKFDHKSPDKIYIDLNSGLLEGKDANDIGKYAMLRTFSHEFVHFVEYWNSVRYNELRKLVFEEITAHGENVNDLIDTKIEETGLSYERASREVVAEAMTDILPDSKFVQNMAENHKSLFNKLLEKLKEFAADIRAYFKTIGSNRDAGAKALKEQVGETVKYLDSIIEMFDTAATEAVETFQKAYAVDEAVSTEQVAGKLENAEASTVSEKTETAETEAAQVKSEPKTTTSEHGYTVTDNTEYGSVEVKFNEKPSEAVRDVLKANKFRWNKAKKVWYGKTSHDAIVDALNKAYEAESSTEAKSDFMKSWEKATQAEKDEVVEAINQNTKLSYIAPTEIREEIPAQAENITEDNDNGTENEVNEGAVHSPQSDGDGAARLLDELQAGDVQRAGGQREAVASAEDRGRQAERDGDRADTSDRSSGSEGNGQSRDLRRDDGVTQEEQQVKVEKLKETVSAQIEQQSTEVPKGSNFVIGESLNLPTGEKSRFRANLDAIKLIKQLEDEGRNATAAEQEVLSKYVGWGGLSNAFGELRYNSETRRSEMMAKTGWEKEFGEFRQLVTDGVITEKEYQGMSASTKNAHYTSVEVIKAMYDGLDQLGFKGGRMLEPSSGVGNFVGGMPVGMSSKVTSWTMVELDRITGLIAKYLYPQANVRIQGFEAANIPDNYMDVAIGNVPFGNYGVVDRHYPKRVTKAIHNYFFAKTLDKVRTGGIVMFITSSFTMNGQDTAIRQYIMDRADLLGAIRLPNTAFAGNAGTEVVTDILVLKKRAAGTEYAGEAFLNAPSRSVGESWQRANVNEYFDNHPEMVLGKAELARGMYGANTLTYSPLTDKGSLGDQIREAFKNITGKMDYTAQVTPEKANFAVERANKKTKLHGLEVKEDGVYRNIDGHLEMVSSDKATAERVSALLGVRDAYRTLVNYLQQGQDAKFVKQARKSLNKAYDDFVNKYGPINSAKNKSALAEDPDQYSLLSLENYDAKKKTATKADIFTKDTITANKTVTHVDDVATGVIVSINRTGGIDASLIAKLTDSTEEAVTRQLIDSRLAFKTKNGELEAPETYLSGNVRAKLRDAEALVPFDSDYKHNVEELKKVIPQDIPFNDIYVSVGSPWIPNNLYADFIAEMLGGRNMETAYSGPDVTVGRTSTGEFKIVLNNKRLKSRYQNTQKWGTSRKSFLDIMDCMMSSTGIKVNDYVEDDEGRRKPVLNKVETAAAQEKAEAITKEFQEWLWRDENRRNELSSLYNETFNALVTPKYNGANLTVNGLNAEFNLREHQANAVQRIISSGGNTLLAHRVGAGKTLEMAAAAMKLRELGIVKKPVFVVPKSLVAQWGVEFKSYFPAARLLVSDEKSFTTANRKVYSNRIANGDYDAVILSYEQFEKIPMSAAYLQDFYQQQIDEIIDAIAEEKAESRDGKGLTVKEMEKKKAQLEKKIAELTSKPKDEDNIDFEQLGIDSLFVDEAHNFKNLQYTTRMNNVSGLSNSNGSQRAFDLYAKVRYLQGLNGGRGIVFATATPVMNSMAEMYIMQKYLQSDMLEQLGLKTFDAWAKQFGEVVNSVEIKPSGQGFRVKQTFSNFRNLSELQLLFRSFSDVLTQVPGLKIPKMKGGKVKTIVCEPGEFQRNYMKLLEQRANNVKNVDPSKDNMLKITSDGRKVSYTQRMIDPSLPYEPGCKLYRCCDNVLKEYKASCEIKGTQIIFCDMATPKGKSKTSKAVSEEVDDDVLDTGSAQLYDDMRAYLVKRGIPKKEIAFIHEADTDAKKKQLFADVNDGKVRVLIGSTGKMGVGMNAQKRIVAIHHLDAPWRPGDVEQRDGRAFRQKNMNDEVSKYTYVTEGSFDARLWDILDRKQHFIDQIMNGEDVGRSAEDTGEVTLSAAEVKALASGNPMIMEQVQLSTDLAKLQDLKRAYNSSITAAKAKLLEDEQRIATLKDSIAKGKQDIKATVDTYSDGKFSMTVGKRKFTEKKDAGKALASEIISKAKEGEFTTVGKFAGFELRVIKQKAEYIGTVVGAQNYRFNVHTENSTYMVNHIIGVIQGIEHKIGVWSDRLTETETDLSAQEAIISSPFAKQAELDAKTSRFNEVMSILNPKDEQVIGDEGDVQYQARKYWRPNLSKAEWALLNNRTEIEISKSSNYLDGSTKWLYAKEKGAEVFALYGVGDGTVPTVLYASGRAKASTDYEQFTSFVKEFKHGTVAYAETTYRWSEIISSVYGAKYGDYDAHGHRRKTVELNEILAEASKRIGRGNSRGSTENSDDVTQHQQRTSPLTDREVLSIAASEVNVEGLTDGERDALNIFKRRLDNLNELEQKRAEEGRKYKEQQFGANIDRAEAQKTLNRMKILDDQIKRTSSEVLDVEKKEVLKRVLQRSRKVVEKAEREHGQELLRRYRDRRNNSAAIKKYRDRIVITSMQLSDWLLKNSDKEHVPEVLKKPVLELLTSIDFSSKRLLSGGQETKADKKFGANLAALNKLLEGQQGAIDGVDDAVDNIGAYLDISAENRQFLNDLVNTVASASSDGTTFTINRMTSEELKNFSHFLKNLSTAIRKANATLANARYENIPSMAHDSMAHMEAMGEARALDGTKLVKLIGWKNATPYYAFKRFGEAGKALFEGLYKGWGKMAFHQQEILKFTKDLYKAKEVRKWRSEIHDITLEDGSKLQMSTAQIMELSMLMKREQALKHINGVGIRIGNIKTKSGIKQDTNYYKLTTGDMANIKKLLTQRQLKVAQEMQKYMAKRGAEWGNEISMARFGYEFYTEGENYYPIKTDDNSRPMRDTDIQGNSMFRLLNLSASKSLNQYANNALVIGDIFDTFTGHMADMAKLNALGLPLLDAIKWFNYRDRTKNPDGTINEQSLTKSMEKAFGKAAGSYFRTLMKDINGVKESGDRSGDIFNIMLTRYKVAAVAANIRVALLQPTSYVRAQYIIEKKHLLNAFVFKKNGYDEAMKYSGTAVWKSLGYYDTDIARSMRTQIENGDTWLDKVRDRSMGLAELGDKRTWGRLWVACKLQTKANNPSLTGEALCKATAELFDEMIYATQVMDSTLTRSEIMRGTTRADKLVSAFGAEPTLSANIVMDAASEYMIDMRKTDARTAWRKNKDKIALAFTTYVSSAAFAALVESLWDAVRDDDDYETFLEKFMQAFLGEDGLLSGNLVQDLTIIGKIPELKAIINVLTGDKSSDMSVAALESISSTYSIWKETIQLLTGELEEPTKVTYNGKMTPWGKIYKTLQALSQVSGVAVSNGFRDVAAVYNTIVGIFAPSKKLKTYDPGAEGSIKHAYLGGTLTETEAIDELMKTGEVEDSDEAYWLVKQWETGHGKYEALKDAIKANDTAAFNSAMSELTENGVEEKKARSEATSIIGDLFNGTDDEPASINAAQATSMLQWYGGKDSDEATDTVNLWKFKAGDEKYKDISIPAVKKYNEYCVGVGISKDMYFDAWSTIKDIHGEDYDGDGKSDAYSAMDKKLSYIDSLSISSSQKTALALANGISETQINNRAPW